MKGRTLNKATRWQTLPQMPRDNMSEDYEKR